MAELLSIGFRRCGGGAGRCARAITPRGAEGQRSQVDDAGRQDDRRPGGQRGVVGDEQPGRREEASRSPLPARHMGSDATVQKRAAAAGSIISPTESSVPSAWKPPTRLSTTSPRKMKWTGLPSRLTERRNSGIEAFGDQRAPEHGEADAASRMRRVPISVSAVVVERQHRAEQHMHQVDAGAAQRYHQHAERQRDQIEGGERGVLALQGGARHRSRRRAPPPRRQSARPRSSARCRGRTAGSRGSTRQDRMRHRVARQAHAPQHQEHADRAGAERQHQRAEKGAAA